MLSRKATGIGAAMVVAAVLCLLRPLRSIATAPADDPLGTILQWDREIKNVVNSGNYQGTPEEKEVLRERIRSILDTEKMGRMTIERHWAKVPDKDRKEFLNLFRTLVERASVADRKVELFRLSDIRYEPAVVNGVTADVKAFVKPKNEQVDVEILYRLYRNGEGWRIYDLVIDEASMIEGFRGQFNKIIAENSFGELLNRMRKKLSDEN